MSRLLPTLLVGLVAMTGAARAQAPAGTWKLPLPGGQLTFLIQLEQKGGKWNGQVLGTSVPNFPKTTLADIAVNPDSLRFNLRLQGQEISFDGKLPPDPKTGKIAGSLMLRADQTMLLHLEPSKLKSFDKYDFAKETVEQSSDALAVANAAVDLLKQAAEKKAKIEEVRGWADKAYKSAEAYGPRWQRSIAVRLAQALAPQKSFGALAVEYARKAERLLDESDDAGVQMSVLEAVVQVMNQAGKGSDAKELQARLSKLEQKDFEEYLKKAPVKAEKFTGRKGKSDRAALVELFTGAECPPCVAADVAFDALEQTYKPSDVILMQYHLHVPGPDPLTNPDTMARAQAYGRKLEGTPTVFFNGKPGAGGGGPLQGGRKKYAEYREVIEPLLEKPAEAKIQLTATRSGSTINAKVSLSDVAKTGESVRLRLFLVEDHVRYTGGNGQRYHHCVVRASLGGANGIAVTKKSLDHEAKINLDELRAKLNQYLDDYAKEEEFPKADRPMSLKNLRVVAFVENDDTSEVMQAAQVEVK
jgi:hypothetical protein